MPEPVILVADDQTHVIEALRLLLKGEGYRSESASSPAAVLASVESRNFDCILMDLNYARDTTSGAEGLDLLSRLQLMDTTAPVVVMTAWGTVDLAVEAMRRGARDFIQKPWENARLLSIIRTQIELAQALRKGQRLEAEEAAERDRRVAGHALYPGCNLARWTVECPRADHRREWLGEGCHRASCARRFGASRESDGYGERWRTFRGRLRE